MIELLSQPEALVVLLGFIASTGLAIRGLPAILERVAKAREISAQAQLVGAETHANALRAAIARALAAERRAAAAESRESALAVELAHERAAKMTERAPALPHERKRQP